jgi:hypothetical protein
MYARQSQFVAVSFFSRRHKLRASREYVTSRDAQSRRRHETAIRPCHAIEINCSKFVTSRARKSDRVMFAKALCVTAMSPTAAKYFPCGVGTRSVTVPSPQRQSSNKHYLQRYLSAAISGSWD